MLIALVPLLTAAIVICGTVACTLIHARTARHRHLTAAIRDIACRVIDQRDGRGRSRRSR